MVLAEAARLCKLKESLALMNLSLTCLDPTQAQLAELVFWQGLRSHPYPFLQRELSPFRRCDLTEMFQFNIAFAMPISENPYVPMEDLDHV